VTSSTSTWAEVIPYGAYDFTRNEAWISVGVGHDTAEFAVATFERWWRETGKKSVRHPPAERVR
jgi:DDE family transposase